MRHETAALIDMCSLDEPVVSGIREMQRIEFGSMSNGANGELCLQAFLIKLPSIIYLYLYIYISLRSANMRLVWSRSQNEILV